MKIYISGKITGLDRAEVRRKFQDSAELLENIGFEVVNPMNNGLPDSASWEKHMCADIEMLLPCEAIYMMDDWSKSLGASIEYDIANRMNKDVWFASNIIPNSKEIMRIQNAIHEVTGLRLNQYAQRSRKRDGFYARMIFVHHCRRKGMKLTKIAEYIHRDHSSMLHLLNKYQDEVKFNSNFRMLAEKVENILSK